MADSPVHLLVNSASRRGGKVGERVAALLGQLGRTTILVEANSAAEVGPALAQNLSGIERLVVVGGDGIVHHSLGVLATVDSSSPAPAPILGIVSSGTGNDFARSLGLPRSIGDAVRAALEPPTPVDLLRLRWPDGTLRFAASVVTAGFSGRVNQTANDLSFPRGQQKYTVATLLEARRLQPFPLRFTVDGNEDHSSCTFFAVGNTRHFGGGMSICPNADPTDGLFDLTVVDEISRWALLRMLPTVFPGRHVRHRAVRTFVGSELVLELDEPLWADGEPLGPGPVTIDVARAALRIAGVALAD